MQYPRLPLTRHPARPCITHTTYGAYHPLPSTANPLFTATTLALQIDSLSLESVMEHRYSIALQHQRYSTRAPTTTHNSPSPKQHPRVAFPPILDPRVFRLLLIPSSSSHFFFPQQRIPPAGKPLHKITFAIRSSIWYLLQPSAVLLSSTCD